MVCLSLTLPSQADADWSALSQAEKDGHLKRLIKKIGKKKGNFTSANGNSRTAKKQSGYVLSADQRAPLLHAFTLSAI